MSSQTLRPMATAVSKHSGPAGWLTRHWRLILLSFLGWSLLAAIPTTSAYLGSGAPGLPVWWAMFKKIGFYYYLWGLVTPLLYRLVDRLPYTGRGLLLALPVHLIVLVSLSFAFGVLSHQAAWHDWLLGPRAVGYHSMSAFTYGLIVLCCLATKFYRLSLLRQREASNARILAAQLDSKLNLARVDSLRMQMNPHFLFNALNSIAALIETEQGERAYQALEQLGDLLRRALRLSQSDEVEVDAEVRFTDAYLSMEQIRFGERLKVAWHVDDDVRSVRIPAFLLQPLVENAIKHGVSPSVAAVTVEITMRWADKCLQIVVADDASKGKDGEHGTGVGISNLRERLKLHYGESAVIQSNHSASGYRTEIRIPKLAISPFPST